MWADLLILLIFLILGQVLRGIFGQKKSGGPWKQRQPRLPRALPEIERDLISGEKPDTELPETVRGRRYVKKAISEDEKVNGQLSETIYEQRQPEKEMSYSKQIYSDLKGQTISTQAPKKATLLLKKDNLLYGIIMKEVLSPPKALYRKDRLI